MESNNEILVKSGNVEFNVAPLFEMFSTDSPQEISQQIEDFVDLVLPHAKEVVETGYAAELFDGLDYMNQLKRTLRRM